MMRKILMYILLITVDIAYSQGPELPSLVPASPTAAGLGKYGQYPISNYTGLPNINIPIYKIKSGEIELPINLTYHSSGVKVTEEAGWVGLGWALNAGGVITRQVRGGDDFDSRGFLSSGNYSFPTKNTSTNTILNQYQTIIYSTVPSDPAEYLISKHTILSDAMKAFSGGHIPDGGYYKYGWLLTDTGIIPPQDSELDLYNYNFMGHTGKLLIKKDENGGLNIFSSEEDVLKFSYNKESKKWTVTDNRGYIYEFGTLEYSRNQQIPCNSSESFIGETYITGWYIDKVKNPKGDEILFQYDVQSNANGYVINSNGVDEQGNFIYSNKPISSTDNKKYSTNISSSSFCSSNNIYKRLTYNYTHTREIYLQKIIFKNGYVLFNPNLENRIDRKIFVLGSTSNNVNPKSLGNISIYEGSKKIEEIKFNCSYFNSNRIGTTDQEKYLRLKLDELIFSLQSENPQIYRFSYNGISLPSKDSFSIDHWGYYNGASNNNIKNYKFKPLPSSIPFLIESSENTARDDISSLIPNYNYLANDLVVFYNGANRDPNENFAQAGVLTSINYPTGGKTNFQYESNQYFNPNGKQTEEKFLFVNSLGINQTFFTINEKTFAMLEFNFTNNANFESEAVIYNKIYNTNISLEKQNINDINSKIRFLPEKDFTNPSYIDGTFKKNTKTYLTVLLEPGTYVLNANSGGYVYFNIDLKVKLLNKQNATNLIGGGLRIKSIQNIDDSGNKYQDNYSYIDETGKSTGKLMSPIFNFYNSTAYMERYMKNSLVNFGDAEATFLNSLRNPIYRGTEVIPSYIESFGNTIVPIGSAAGGRSIGYDQVTVTKFNQIPFSKIKNVGKSVYKYKNYIDSQYGIAFPNIKDKQHKENGQITDEYHYDGLGKSLVEKNYTYIDGSFFKVEGLRIIQSSSPYCFDNPMLNNSSVQGSFPCDELIRGLLFDRFYEEEINLWQLSQIIEKKYFNDNSVPIITTKNFFYENLTHKQQTKEETLFPDGVTMNKTFKYADEVGNQLMKDKNMIGIPLITESNKIINGTSKSLQKVETYFPKITSELTNTNDLMLPIWTKTYGLNNLSSGNNFVSYDKYDSKGNILQYSTKGLKPTTVIWGYNQTLPIAKIDGISYNELANLLGFSNTPDGYTNLPIVTSSNLDIDSSSEQSLISNLDSFRTNSNLANYQITTYTYNPIVGLTSITPATGIREFYKYDESNRLNQIIDVNGKILKEYSYHYSNNIPDDVVYSSISGPENINVYTTYLNAQASYSLNLANPPNDLNFYWSINPTIGVSYPSANNSPNINLTFNNSGQYTLSLYVIQSSTGESLSLNKTINVNVIPPPVEGSNSLSAISPVEIHTSGIYINGNAVSGYFVFKPGIINGSKDIALISSDKTPYTDKTVNYHETSTGVDRTWKFIFKSSGVVTASYIGTLLSAEQSIYIPSFQYQR